jgi:RNA polymerase sigma-70 factor (ECF subfamily)
VRVNERTLISRDEPTVVPEEGTCGEVADWVRRARGGDQGAFARLVERHEHMVLRTALRLLGRMDLAQDAAQEAFLRMHRYLDRFDEAQDLGPWLYRVTVNACHDVARSGSKQRLVALDEMPEASDPAGRFGPMEIEATVLQAEQQRLVKEALRILPEKERTALVLRDIEGLPTGEVARILGSSEGTVRSQVSTARLKIRRFVERKQERRG